MFCENCGKEISDAAVMCPSCKIYTKNITAEIKAKMPEDIRRINEIPELKKRFEGSDTFEMREIIQELENMRDEGLSETIIEYKYRLMLAYIKVLEEYDYDRPHIYNKAIGIAEEIKNYKDVAEISETLTRRNKRHQMEVEKKTDKL